jgi:hypothetical protein
LTALKANQGVSSPIKEILIFLMFRSQVKARFRPNRTWLGQALDIPGGEDVDLDLPNPAISACHVRGRDENNLQWHIQVNGAYEPVGFQGRGLSAEERAQRSSRLFTGLAPDNGDTLTPEQSISSEGYVIVCTLHFIHFDSSA